MVSAEELISRARGALIGIRKQATGVANYGCITEGGLSINQVSNQMCHSGCAAFVTRNAGVVLYTIASGSHPASPQKIPADVQKRYFSWLCSGESPWAECLCNDLNDDPKFVAEYGLLIDNMSKLGKNLVIASLAASRACFEHPKHIIMWDRLVQEGLEPRWAYFLCGFSTLDTSDNVFYGMQSNQNHWPIHPWSASEEYIKNFLGQKVSFDKVPFASEKVGGPIGSAWGPYDEIDIPKYSSKCYGQSRFWTNFKKRSKAGERSVGGFGKVECSSFRDFLATAKQEQERLSYAT